MITIGLLLFIAGVLSHIRAEELDIIVGHISYDEALNTTMFSGIATLQFLLLFIMGWVFPPGGMFLAVVDPPLAYGYVFLLWLVGGTVLNAILFLVAA